jgi:hypothetical protein
METHCVFIEELTAYKYYVFGHYRSSCLHLKNRRVYFSKHDVSETGFCLRLQVKPTQLGPIDRASPYIQIRTIVQSSQTFRS